MALSLAAAGIAGTAAAAAYLDAKYHIGHDLRHAGSLNNATAAAQAFIAEKQAQNRLLLYHLIEDHALANRPNHLFLEFEGRSWTYRQFYDDLQRVGNWLMNDLGIKKGEMVAIDGPNSPEYLLLWYALDGIGACTSFVNCNLTGAALIHCAKLCDSRYLIAERSIENLVGPCEDELTQAGIKTIYYDQHFIESMTDSTPLPKSRQVLMGTDVRSLIYTSGTTGLPKGVMMLTGRIVNFARAMAVYLKLKPEDHFYTCLPLYHGAAQGLCFNPAVFAGAAVTLGRKFSHRTFWPEVSQSRANILQYVGELCRYLVNAPPHPLERQHCLREAWGNGMRPDVWEKFRQRFNIPVIHELYAATDGLGATFNRNQNGYSRNAIAVRGLLWRWRNGQNEIRARIDGDTEDIVRDNDGFVVRAKIGEPGEVLHKADPAMKEALFKGYFKNPTASEKRWMTDVFVPGDLYFRSGDVMRQDRDGRVYFVDRLGDTYRWRSENISTNEVADVLGGFEQVAECNVYGVAVPNADGRCGCATIVPTTSASMESFDFRGLAAHVKARLPRYAVPLFIRFAPQLSYTGTFKIQKGQAKREGIDLDLIEKAGSKDKVFWLPPGGEAYVPFKHEDLASLRAGRVML